MGSWSEECAVSGMEIREQAECYVVLLKRDRYDPHRYCLATGPVRGVYADYGTLDIDQTDHPIAKLFNLPLDEEGLWTPRDMDETLAPMWIDAQVFAKLGELVRDFSHAGVGGTVTDDLEIHMKDVDASIADALKWKELLSEYAPNDLWVHKLNDILGRGAIADFSPVIANLLRGNTPLTYALQAYRRAYILIGGCMELRKPLIPQSRRSGPQWGGETALIDFYEFVLDVARKRA